MLDRQGEDIDALLIGALYGELTPADEARLSAHLESHPADRSALADLTFARKALHESRFLTVQLEPPQAVSALLLQEASRRAPAKVVAKDNEKSESWFARFVASFARHPAWAAAAMMVVVVGVAGTMYLRGGNTQFAEQSTSTFADAEKDRTEKAAMPAAAPAPGGAPAQEPSVTEEADKLVRRAGSGYPAGLTEDTAVAAPTDQRADLASREESPRADPKPTAKAAAAGRTYLGIQSERSPQPKELEQQAGDDGDARRRVAKGEGVGGAASPEPATTAVAPPPPPAPAPRAATRTGTVVGSDELARDGKADEETSWAREQAVKVGNAVTANNCKDAASLALQLSNRAPAFYRDNVENDRELKKCQAYINAEREKEADRQQKTRAIQKRNADEANQPRRAPATTNSK